LNWVGVVYSRTRQFVLLFGTLLSFADGSPLFAGLISLPGVDDCTPGNNQSWDLPHQPEGNSCSEASLLAEPLVSQASDQSIIQGRSASLCCGLSQELPSNDPQSFEGPEPSGLPSNDQAPPLKPQPSAPAGGGAAGATGFVQGGSKMQQDGLVNWSYLPIPEGSETAISNKVQFISDAWPLGIFRPPRFQSNP
jgi:hypothetical protein